MNWHIAVSQCASLSYWNVRLIIRTIALAWILRHPSKIQAIIGTANIDRIRRSAQAMNITLTRPEWYKMYKLAGNMIP